MNTIKKEPNGILIVNKPAGMTSHDVVNAVRRIYKTRRVGHTGTLDPMASGVLVVLVGRAAKASEYVSHSSKKYVATLKLGITTDTEDTTGSVLSSSDNIPSADEVIKVAGEFKGGIMQTPPMYSALKVGGKKLVDLAREGVVLERQARPITVFDISCTPTDKATEFVLDVHCSGGTYIRTLCADIGARLGCGGAMASLLRTEACGFSIDRSYTPDELREFDEEKLENILIPTEKLFDDCPTVQLPAFYEKLCRSGCEIYQSKIGTNFEVGKRVRICGHKTEDNPSGFFALGEVISPESCKEAELGSAIKSIKMFSLE